MITVSEVDFFTAFVIPGIIHYLMALIYNKTRALDVSTHNPQNRESFSKIPRAQKDTFMRCVWYLRERGDALIVN